MAVKLLNCVAHLVLIYYFTYRRDTVQTHSKCFLNVVAITKIKKNCVFYKITQMDLSRFGNKFFNYSISLTLVVLNKSFNVLSK